MQRLKKFEPHLQALANSQETKKVLAQSPDEVIHILCEIIYNVLKGHVPLSKEQIKRLKPHRKILRQVLSCCNSKTKRINVKKGRQYINQTGGALPLILSTLLPIIGKAFLGGTAASAGSLLVKKISGK